MHFRIAVALSIATAVLAKKGGGTSHSGGGGDSSGSSSSSSSNGILDPYYFTWNTWTLSEFILAIIYGVFTLFGGGYWLWKRYNPATRAARLTSLLWSTWFIWTITIVYFALVATWNAAHAHNNRILLVFPGEPTPPIAAVRYPMIGLESFTVVGWMFVLLILTHVAWKTSATEMETPPRTHFLFHFTLLFLALSALVGGIIQPVLNSKYIFGNPTTRALTMVSAVFTFIAACLLLAFVVIAGKVARSAGRLEKPDPFRWILFIAVPLWVVRAFVEFVLTALGTANVRVNTLINPLTLLLGIASLATIAALPSAVITTKTNKEVEA